MSEINHTDYIIDDSMEISSNYKRYYDTFNGIFTPVKFRKLLNSQSGKKEIIFDGEIITIKYYSYKDPNDYSVIQLHLAQKVLENEKCMNEILALLQEYNKPQNKEASEENDSITYIDNIKEGEEKRKIKKMTIKFLEDCNEKNDTVILPFEDMKKVYNLLKERGLNIFEDFEYEPKKGKLGRRYRRLNNIILFFVSILLISCIVGVSGIGGIILALIQNSKLATFLHILSGSFVAGLSSLLMALPVALIQNIVKTKAEENMLYTTLFEIERIYPKIKEKDMSEGKTQENFLQCIYNDIEFIKTQDASKFGQEIKDLGKLADDYTLAIKMYAESGAPIDQVAFIERLVVIESSISSKAYVGNATRLDSEYLTSRLQLLGIDSKEMLNDRVLQLILDDIKRIESYRYPDCEQELQDLYKIALKYVQNLSNNPKNVAAQQQAIKELVAVEMRINNNIDEQINQTSLNEDLEKIKKALRGLEVEKKEDHEESSKVPKGI